MDTQDTEITSIVRQLAIELVKVEHQMGEGQNVLATNLSPTLRHAWEKLVWQYFQVGELPPRTLPELIQWLHHPLKNWPVFGHEIAAQGWIYALLEEGYVSDFCLQIGSPLARSTQLRLELEDEYFKALYTYCYQKGLVEAYTEARLFINEHPLVEDVQEEILNRESWDMNVAFLLRQCYEELPPAAIHQKQVILCPHCNWPLNWKRDEASCYQGSRCQQIEGDLAESGRRIQYVPGMHRTKEGVQRYVSAPEIDLMRLYQKLSNEWGVQVTLYPHLDAYDLFIKFANGNRWAVDMKDYQNPAQLALELNDTSFGYLPVWDTAFYVFPNDRATQDYLNRFGNLWKRQKGVTFLSYSAFVKRLNKALRS